jgi:hypothetical protein
MTREPKRFAVLGFASTHDALDAEALLEDLGIEVVPVPAPPSVSGGCGIALRLRPDEAARALNYLENARISVAGKQEIEDV